MLPSAHQLAPPLPTVPRYKLVICRGDTSADLTAAAQVICSTLRAANEDLVALEAVAVVDHLRHTATELTRAHRFVLFTPDLSIDRDN